MPRHTICIAAGALCLLLGGALFWGGWLLPVAHAAAPVFPQGTEQTIADLAGYAILGLNLLTWVLFVFLNFLLDPQFIFGGAGGNLLGILNEIWQLARDLMNIVFALALVGAAIYTIVTAKKEFLSQYGPKFIVAVVLVNFSWFLPRVVIDVANVGAAAVYGIPSLLANNPAAQCFSLRYGPPAPPPTLQCQALPADPNTYRCPCMGVVDAQFFLTQAEALQRQTQGYTCPLGPMLCYRQQRLDFGAVAPFSAVLNGLVINHARLGALAAVPTPPPNVPGGEVNRMIMFLLREMLILIIHIALLFPLLAITIAFFIRIPVLWITMAFMPFYFLDFLLGGQFEQLTQGYGKKILTSFLKAAFLPLLVAVPFSIGLLMLNAGTMITGNPIAGIPIRLFDQVNNFWQLLWLCMSLGVIWVGVFAVLKGDDILSSGAQSIKQYGESLGRIALKAPLAVPTLPASMGGGSYLGLLQRSHPRNIESALSSGVSIKQLGDSVLGRTPPSKDAREAAERLNTSPDRDLIAKLANEARTSTDALRQLIKTMNNPRNWTGTSEANIHLRLDEMQRAGAKLGLGPEAIKQIEETSTKLGGEAKKKAEEAAKNTKANPPGGPNP